MSMGLYSGRAYYRRIFATEIWGTYLREGLGGRVVVGIMEFYGILFLRVMLWLADSFLSLHYLMIA